MSTNYYWAYTPTDVQVSLTLTLAIGRTKIVDLHPNLPVDLDPTIHIGKRSGAGTYCLDCNRSCSLLVGGMRRYLHECPGCNKIVKTTTCRFTWAQEPEEVVQICEENLDKNVVMDEYGGLMTGKDFLNLINGCLEVNRTLIGKEFC